MNALLLVAMLMHTTTPAPEVLGREYGALRVMPEVAVRNATNANQLTTTKVQPFSDLAADQVAVSYVQHIVVLNLDTTGTVCITATAPTTACTAVTFSCLGAASGWPVPPGASQQIDFTGEVRVCAIASEAATDAAFSRAVLHAQ
jgi:hypothetical protein